MVCKPFDVVKEQRPITATTATATPAKNFFVFIIVCAMFVSHPTSDYAEIDLVCLLMMIKGRK